MTRGKYASLRFGGELDPSTLERLLVGEAETVYHGGDQENETLTLHLDQVCAPSLVAESHQQLRDGLELLELEHRACLACLARKPHSLLARIQHLRDWTAGIAWVRAQLTALEALGSPEARALLDESRIIDVWNQIVDVEEELDLPALAQEAQRAGLAAESIALLEDLAQIERGRARAVANKLVAQDDLLVEALLREMAGGGAVDVSGVGTPRWLVLERGSGWMRTGSARRALARRWGLYTQHGRWIGLVPEAVAYIAESAGGERASAIELRDPDHARALARLALELHGDSGLHGGSGLEIGLAAARAALANGWPTVSRTLVL